MAPKNKFTRAEMTAAALGIVRADGAEHLTAKTLAAALGISTQPVFTCFGSMEGGASGGARCGAAGLRRLHHRGTAGGDPFFRSRNTVYPLCAGGADALPPALSGADTVRRRFCRAGALTGACASVARADLPPHGGGGRPYFRDLWLVVHSLATLIVTGGCPYTDREIGQILTGFSLSICKSIKEVPGFAAGTFDRDAAFRALLGEKE